MYNRNSIHFKVGMASVKKHLPLLKLVQVANPKLRKSVIISCDLDFIKTIIECIYNTLNGNFPLTDKEKTKLKKFKLVLRKILKAKGGLKEKRKIIVAGGSFLPTLLHPIVLAAEHTFLHDNEVRT